MKERKSLRIHVTVTLFTNSNRRKHCEVLTLTNKVEIPGYIPIYFAGWLYQLVSFMLEITICYLVNWLEWKLMYFKRTTRVCVYKKSTHGAGFDSTYWP